MEKKSLAEKSRKRTVYPIGSEHYIVYEEIGKGVSTLVHRALCIPLNEIVAIKILDFERDKCDLSRVSQEAQIMVLIDHPNVLKCHCSFVCDYTLWVVMPYMAGGSCLHILKAAYPDDFKEVVIAIVLRKMLKGLEYLHGQGYIHWDVKDGTGGHGAIVWLLLQVLLMTLKNEPQGQEVLKDPSKRPTAKKLLKHALFKQARSNDYISRALLEGLPSLGDRVKALKNEYKRGISGWNFNLEDLKAHASLATPESLAATQPLPPDPTLVNLFSESIFPVLQNVLQATTIGRESIISAMRQVNRGDSTVDAGCIPSYSAGVEKSLLEAALEREKDLHREIADLWWRLKRAQEELQKYKTENKSSK